MVEAVKEKLCINRIVGSKNFNVTVEGDCIIPDTKPDILNSINMTGNVCVYKKEIMEGKIRLDGNVNIYLMYLADCEEGRIRGINCSLDFTEILDFPGVEPGMMLDEEINIKGIECKVLNGRKVSLKAMLEITANVSMNENEEIVKEVSNVDDIQTQVTTLRMNSLVRAKFNKSKCKRNINNR